MHSHFKTNEQQCPHGGGGRGTFPWGSWYYCLFLKAGGSVAVPNGSKLSPRFHIDCLILGVDMWDCNINMTHVLCVFMGLNMFHPMLEGVMLIIYCLDWRHVKSRYWEPPFHLASMRFWTSNHFWRPDLTVSGHEGDPNVHPNEFLVWIYWMFYTT